MNPLIVHFRPDLDIKALHKKVLERIRAGSPDAALKCKELETIDKAIRASMSMSEIKHLKIRRMYTQRQVDKLDCGSALKCYTLEAMEYVKTAPAAPSDVDAIPSVYSRDIEKRSRFVSGYLQVVSKYVAIEIVGMPADNNESKCVGCGDDLSHVKSSTRGSKVCRCGVETQGSKAMIAAPKEYYVWGNFLKSFQREVGDIIVPNVRDIMTILDNDALSRDEKPGIYYRSLPLDEYGFKEGTSAIDLEARLTRTNQTVHLDSYAYIGHMYYGWMLRKHLKPRLKELENNFKVKQEVWNSMSVSEREASSSICNKYRMCREFQHIGERCRLRDFGISGNKTTIEKYDRVYKVMCEKAGFSFPHCVEENEADAE